VDFISTGGVNWGKVARIFEQYFCIARVCGVGVIIKKFGVRTSSFRRMY
jgi:hypothetical protein